jgi:hypothetical protein
MVEAWDNTYCLASFHTHTSRPVHTHNLPLLSTPPTDTIHTRTLFGLLADPIFLFPTLQLPFLRSTISICSSHP